MPTPEEQLHAAALAGDLAGVQSGLAAGADVSSMYDDSGVLCHAVRGESIDVLRALLEAGAPIDTTPSPMIRAVHRLPQMRLLLEYGGRLDTTDRLGAGLVSRAVEGDPDPEPARFLLDQGAPLELADVNGWTALMFAAHWDQRWDAVVELLLGRGANPNHKSHDGWTPLLLACHAKVVDTGPVQLLLADNDIDVNIRGKQFGWTPLLKAVAGQYCCDSLVVALLARGADPNAAIELDVARPVKPKRPPLAVNLYDEFKVSKKLNGTTPLMFALKKKRAKAATALCEAGADVHAQTAAGDTVESFAKSKAMKAMLAKHA